MSKLYHLPIHPHDDGPYYPTTVLRWCLPAVFFGRDAAAAGPDSAPFEDIFPYNGATFLSLNSLLVRNVWENGTLVKGAAFGRSRRHPVG